MRNRKSGLDKLLVLGCGGVGMKSLVDDSEAGSGRLLTDRSLKVQIVIVAVSERERFGALLATKHNLGEALRKTKSPLSLPSKRG